MMSVLVLPQSQQSPVVPISLVRLVLVELRKTFDTRAARTVVGVFILIGALLYGYVMVSDDAASLSSAGLVGIFVGVGIPLVTALVMTSEWSQRTAMTTFWLEPRRLRVLSAKTIAAIMFAIGSVTVLMAISLVLGVVVLLIRGQPLDLTGVGYMLRMVYCYAFTGALFGVAWGALFMSTPVTLVFILVISLLVDLVLLFTVGDHASWFSSSTFSDWLLGERAFSGAVLTSTTIWYVAPLTAGIWLQTKREVR